MYNKTPLPVRSILFLPATKLDKWHHAVESGADSICIDLEDSVGLDKKDYARKKVISFFKKHKSFPITLSVRINPINTFAGLKDFKALLETDTIPGALMIPKVCYSRDIQIINDVLDEHKSQCTIIAIIETVEGLRNTSQILEHPRCRGAIFGGIDLAQQIGCKPSWNTLVTHRSNFVRDAVGKNVTLIDTPHFALDDKEGLAEETRLALELGFNAKAAIHPNHISIIQNIFTPSKDEIKEAKQMIREFNKYGGQVIQFKGKVIEKPVIESAKQMLAYVKEFPKD
ncbi:MAG: CoA ester lyase [Balneolales bacterium]